MVVVHFVNFIEAVDLQGKKELIVDPMVQAIGNEIRSIEKVIVEVKLNVLVDYEVAMIIAVKGCDLPRLERDFS